MNSKNISNIVGASSQQIKKAIAQIIKNKMISFKIDVASRQDKHILGVNIQYIRDFKVFINTIGKFFKRVSLKIIKTFQWLNKRFVVTINTGMIQLNKRHTAQYLKDEVMKCLAEYNIDISQIYSNTTDNGANVVKVSKLLQELQDENLSTADNVNSTYYSFEYKISYVFSVVRCAAHTIQQAAYCSFAN